MPSEGQTAVNRKTGQRAVYQGGQWVASGGAQSPMKPDIQRDAATLPYAAPKAAADLNNTTTRTSIALQAERRAGQAEARAFTAQELAAKLARDAADAERRKKLAPLKALDSQLRRTWDAYSSGVGSTKGAAGAMDFLPSPGNKSFDSLGAGLAEVGLNAFRTPGIGSQSDAELKAFVEANRPSSWNYDDTIKTKLGNLEGRLKQAYGVHGIPYNPYRPKQKGLLGGRKAATPGVVDFKDWKD